MSETRKIPISQRDTDFMKMDSLNYLAGENGLSVMRFQQAADGKWSIDYFDRSRWIEPQRAFLPTDTIYRLQMEDYIKRCTVSSKSYARFDDMVLGEIQRLKEKLE